MVMTNDVIDTVWPLAMLVLLSEMSPPKLMAVDAATWVVTAWDSVTVVAVLDTTVVPVGILVPVTSMPATAAAPPAVKFSTFEPTAVIADVVSDVD
jgi:hypothetical protein